VPGEGLVVQVCWSMSGVATREREIGALQKPHVRNPLRRMVAVAREVYDRVTLAGGGMVEIVPLAEWLLENEGRKKE